MSSGKLSWTKGELQVLNSEIGNLKKIMVHTIAENCSTGLFNSKFQVWGHIVDKRNEF